MEKKFNKSQVFTISASHLAHDTYSSFLAPLLPLLIEKLGMSLSASAILDIARRIPALFNPFFGLLAERVGARYFVIFTPAVTAISMSFVGLASSYVVLFILLLVAGISAALFHVPSPTMIKEASGDKVGTGMSFFMVGGELARTVGPLLVTAGVSWWGLEGIYKLMPIGLVASLILYIKLRNFEIHKPLSKKPEKGDTKKVLVNFTPFFLVLGGFMLFQSAMKSALTLYLPVYLINQGFGLWYAGISLAVLQFFGVLGTLMAGHFSDKIGRKNMLVLSSTVAAISMTLFVLYSHEMLFFLLLLLGLSIFASGPVLLAAVHDTNSSMPTFINSLYMSINFGVSSFIVFGVGFMGDKIGLEGTYQICAALAYICIPFAFFVSYVTNKLKDKDKI